MKYKKTDKRMPESMRDIWSDILFENYHTQISAYSGTVLDYALECAYKEATEETETIKSDKADSLFQLLQLRKRNIKTFGDLRHYNETWWK